MLTKERVIEALKEVFDPEIPINIVDLGLIYGIEIEGNKVHVKMTLTARGCPLAGAIAMQAKDRLLKLEGVEDAEVEIVWDPPWTVDRISEEGKRVLRSYGLYI